ncbi:MAG: ComF family protein [Promethearchaeota archaeon]
MVKEDGDYIILNDHTRVERITGSYCCYCLWKIDPSYYQCPMCYNDKPSFEFVIALGYYIPGWYNNITYTDYPSIDDVDHKYRFEKLITDSKSRCIHTNESTKKEYIRTLCEGLSFVLSSDFKDVVEKVDYSIHIPKVNEDQGVPFNHGYYYAKYLSEMQNIDFRTDIIKEIEGKAKNSPERFEFVCDTDDLKGKRVIIIDDVYTKGITKRTLSRRLVQSGVEEVYIGVVGRSRMP